MLLEEAVYGGVLRLAEAAVKRNVKCEPFDGFLNLSKVDGFLNLSKVEVCSFDPGKEKTFDIFFRSERCPL